MKLIYLYHSGFALLAEHFTVIIDYFQDSQSLTEGIVHDSLLNRPGKLYVLSSHFHADHFNRRVMNWRERKADIVYILSKDICRKRGIAKPTAHWLKKGETYQDENLWVKAYGSTDAGISFELQLCGKTIFHAGDLNNWHWMDESDEAEWRGYENHFLKELENICSSMPAADLVLFPVDPRLGSEYMRGAIQFTEKIQTRAFLHPGIAQFAFGFYSVMLTSTILGFFTMVLFKPRSWCVYCPMGTMTQLICKAKQKGQNT